MFKKKKKIALFKRSMKLIPLARLAKTKTKREDINYQYQG